MSDALAGGLARPVGTIDYHMHILIGVQASGSMTVI